MFLNESNLEKIAAGDLDALAQADAEGFICGASEDATAFSERLRAFSRNCAALESALESTRKYDCEGIVVTPQDRIDARRFAAIAPRTQALYGFAIDWVPGFYVDPSFSFLFGGCAYCQYPDFFTMFIIRRSFKRKARWLIYDRDELLSHELCHVAHIGLESRLYEETFAYRTSASAFRRLIGGMFCCQTDSFMFLGAAFLLLLAQVIRTFCWAALPLSPFWLILVAVFAWLGIRHYRSISRLNRALHALELEFGDNAWNVLFRCTDEEIIQLAKITEATDVGQWLGMHQENTLRWKIIMRRFPPMNDNSINEDRDTASTTG